jgi:predicted NBD/HSP70 family sugar kinase
MADHRQVVLDAIRDNGPIRLRDVERLTGLGRTTVAGLIADLRAQGAVVTAEAERTESPSSTGRPPLMVALNPDLARVVGVLFEHTHIRAAVADLGLNRLGANVHRMRVADDPRAALRSAAEMVEALIGSTKAPRRQIIGVAMALAAPIDVPTGTVKVTSALEGWVDLQPAAELSRRLQLPVKIDNDAALAGFGEAVTGAARGSRHVVYVKLSASIGCGIVIDGSPYGGQAGTAGELAHLVVNEGGALCFCGNRGCLHTVVGAHAILADLRSTHAQRIREVEAVHEREGSPLTLDGRLRLVIDWARAGDPACLRALRDVAGHVGLALVNVCNLLNPETIVVGGVLSEAGDLLFGPLRERVHTYTKHLSASPVRIVPPELGEWAEVLGACALVIRSNTPAFRRRLQALTERTRTDPPP